MIWLLALAAVASAPDPAATAMAEATHALDQGRLEQAQLMIADALAKGRSGADTDRLLARLALAEHHDEVARAGFEQLLKAQPHDPALLTGAATAAARQLDDKAALSLATEAARQTGADWRTFNLLGVLADRRGDWAAADAAYADALRRAPGESTAQNNAGWSQLARGKWASAAELFRKAAAAQPGNRLYANNLELAEAALAAELPRRRQGEDDAAFAARLNDAGMAARLLGDRPRAIAAFSRAVEVSGHWDARAYNNLVAIQAAR
ncbi:MULTISPECIES: hypothetical protein [Sphingomonas]|uniref:hypothetical protein n=1 Tax=Sphingomonas TaxID=13687 RepID=UPI000DEFA733|nr:MULTISPECIES: hypothetical protein [Sphingomonas]